MKAKLITLLNIFFTWSIVVAREMPLSGLYFSSHEMIKDQRTSLNLTSDKTFNFSRGFALEFDANFRRGDGHYGYIFRMIGDQKNNIDFVSNLASESVNFWLILKDSTLISYEWEEIPDGKFDQWMKIRFHIDPLSAQVSLSLNNKKKTMSFDRPFDLSRLNIIFGACTYASYFNSNVSPMTLKDIRLYDHKQELYRHWKLSKHGRQYVYDEVAHAPAQVLNPSWLIDKHIHWRHLKKIQFDHLVGVTQNESTGQVFFVGDKAISIYTSDPGKLDIYQYLGGIPFLCKNNQVYYNSYTDELWSYNFDKNQMNKFDFVTQKWSLSDPDCSEPDFGHHIKFISPFDSSLITFGGYGHYKYKSIFNHFDPQKGAWEKFDISKEIPPRYLSSSGFLDKSRILIFGGYGSKSGRQELSPEFYYDLYTIDLKDLSVNHRWSAENTSDLVPCNNLIFDPVSETFLTLLYSGNHFETSLRLVRMGLDSPENQILADSIPYKFLDTKSWSNLFLNKKKSELLAVTVYDSVMNLYSLAYPPLMSNEVYQNEVHSNGLTKLWKAISYFLLSAIIIFAFLINRKSRKNNPMAVGQVNTISYDPAVFRHPGQQKKNSSIYLFGGLQAFDKKGKDITSCFTPTLKELFLLMLLYSLKNGKGVSSQMLNETLWFDKPGDSARNNRNVNISKLRSLLDEIGNIELSKESTFWKITLDQNVYCDYIEILCLLKKNRPHVELHENEIHKLLAIASSGELLPDIQNEWIDVYKSDFSNLLIDALMSLSQQMDERASNYNLSYHIAKCILKHDTLNENAIAIKCTALYNLGKKGLARRAYDSFCREYKNLMEAEFTTPFNELLKGHTKS